MGHTAGTRPHRTGDGRRGTHSGGAGGDTEGRGTDNTDFASVHLVQVPVLKLGGRPLLLL